MEALAALGEATIIGISEHTGLAKMNISSLLSELRYPHPTLPKRVYIKGWEKFVASDGRKRNRPIFALGNLPDADKPAPRSIAEIKREWRLKHKKSVEEEPSTGIAGFQWPPVKDSDE